MTTKIEDKPIAHAGADGSPALALRLVRCVRVLGLRLGWRYWRIETRALVNPWLVLDWANACEREADALDAKREGLLAKQHRAWAAELRASYARFMSSPNISR